MTPVIAQVQDDGRIADPSIIDNEWLDSITFHFGEWVNQIVFWTDQNLGGLLRAIKWPFETLIELLMSNDEARTSIMDIPWYWVAIAFFVIGSVARNTRVGFMVATMVAICGMLGPDYWSVTARTFGMVFVAVLLCAIIGVPLGILCGRIDAVWNVVRPTLDAMQVIHSFVYMLPFIFFFQVGDASATMVTMVFALPPIVRLTNLGIRQVPEDVVEASRSYGASEPRVLTDVQLPLARPAIMTGLNQTLLLAISMLGITALMGSFSLGTLLLRAISSQNLPLAASGGLAFFLVAVVLDRISQREIDDGKNLLVRMREAFAYRRDSAALEGLVAEEAAQRAAIEVIEEAEPAERPAPVSGGERTGLLIAALGAVGALVAVLLPWGNDAGLIAAWGRRSDEAELIGQSAAGWEASGGSVFGVLVFVLGILALLAAARPLFSFKDTLTITLNQIQYVLFWALGAVAVLAWILNMLDVGLNTLSNIGLVIFGVLAFLVVVDVFVRGTPRLGADGALIAAMGAFGSAIGYLVTRPSPFTEQYSHGIGVYVAIAATAIAIVGALMALGQAPYLPKRPLDLSVSWGSILGAVFGVGLLFVGCYAAWMIDERLDSLITPEIQAQIEQLREEAGNDINKQIANGQEITNLINSAQAGDSPNFFGFLDSGDGEGLRQGNGPRLGWPTFIFGVLAALASIMTALIAGRNETRIWQMGTIATGFGLAAIAVPLAWIFSFARSAEPTALTGAGTFFALAAAFILFAIGQSSIGEFRRRKIYADVTSATTGLTINVEDAEPSSEEALVTA